MRFYLPDEGLRIVSAVEDRLNTSLTEAATMEHVTVYDTLLMGVTQPKPQLHIGTLSHCTWL